MSNCMLIRSEIRSSLHDDCAFMIIREWSSCGGWSWSFFVCHFFCSIDEQIYFDKKILQRNLDPGWHFLLVVWCLWCRLLCVEHIDKNGKPLLYLVFEYLDTDLKKYIDAHGRSNKNPLPTNIIKVMTEYKSCNTQFNLHRRFGFFCVFLLWKKEFSPVFLWLKMPSAWCGCRASCISCAKELHTVTAMVSCTGMSWIEYRSCLQNVLLDLLPIV
jgi:hypothetical protein